VFILRYFVVLFLLYGCSNSVLAQCIQDAQITAEPVQCYSFRNGTITIEGVAGGTPPYYYSIDGTTFSTRAFFEFLWPGDYTVTILDSMGCQFLKNVTVEEPPVLEVDLRSNKLQVAIGEPFTLTAMVLPSKATIVQLSWRPPYLFDDETLYTQNMQQGISESTVFAVEVVDDNGCTARDQLEVRVRKSNVFVPNIISVGSNQDAYFTVFADEFVPLVRYLRIFDRNGALMFERSNFPPNDPLLGWNGRHTYHKPQLGVYTWVAEVIDMDGNVDQLQGSLTVIR
jgi:hypothetical protein